MNKTGATRRLYRENGGRGTPTVLGVDPGLAGAFVLTDGNKIFEIELMPVNAAKEIPYPALVEILAKIKIRFGPIPVYLERAVSFGMGTKAAFNYGRGFQSIVIAVMQLQLPLTLVEPAKWTKQMHAGISADLRPKVKSMTAVERLYPHLVGKLPKNRAGKYLDGPVDALLIAGYGVLQCRGVPQGTSGLRERYGEAIRAEKRTMKKLHSFKGLAPSETDENGDFY